MSGLQLPAREGCLVALEGQRFNDHCRPIPSVHSPSGDRIGTRSQSGSKAWSAEITHLTCALATGEEAFARFSEPVEDESPEYSQHKEG